MSSQDGGKLWDEKKGGDWPDQLICSGNHRQLWKSQHLSFENVLLLGHPLYSSEYKSAGGATVPSQDACKRRVLHLFSPVRISSDSTLNVRRGGEEGTHIQIQFYSISRLLLLWVWGTNPREIGMRSFQWHARCTLQKKKFFSFPTKSFSFSGHPKIREPGFFPTSRIYAPVDRYLFPPSPFLYCSKSELGNCGVGGQKIAAAAPEGGRDGGQKYGGKARHVL